MSRDVVSLGASARARDAAAAIVHNRISAVPVLDERSGLPVLIGIVTVTDLLDHSLGTLREESPVQAAV
jgi:CBS-domain-containing membrane protein